MKEKCLYAYSDLAKMWGWEPCPPDGQVCPRLLTPTNCKELGANYKVREKSPNETTLTSDISCRFGGGVREEWGGGGFPKHPQVPKFSRKTPRTHCKVVYSQLKGTNYKQQKGTDAQGNICEGLNTKLLLSSVQICRLVIWEAFQALVCRIFIVSSVSRHDWLVAGLF